jgi:2-dehydro-3-deoxygluconokinase
MKIELRKNFTWALVVPTSMGVRITPLNGQPVHCSDTFHMQATSAETNVVSVSSSLGLPVKILTTFVKDSPIARFIKDNLSLRHIAYEGVELEQGGPWGYRHQFNIADSGYGSRGPRVHNDRAGEVGRTLNVKDFWKGGSSGASSFRPDRSPVSRNKYFLPRACEGCQKAWNGYLI